MTTTNPGQPPQTAKPELLDATGLGEHEAMYMRAGLLPARENGERPFGSHEARTVPRERPVIGWRFWALADGSPVPPYSPDPETCHVGEVHPSPQCSCGVRAFTSLSALVAYLRIRDVTVDMAIGRVEMWGHLAGPAYEAGDWPRTIRAQFAEVTT